MTALADHIIQKLTIIPSLSTSPQTSDVPQQLRRLSHDVIPAIVDRVFAACELPQQEVVLEKIQVDLGTLKLDELSRSFPVKLAQSLKKALETELGAVTFHSDRATTPGSGFPGSEALTAPDPEGEKDISDPIALLAYFFKTGVLPPHIRQPLSVKVLADELLTDQLSAFVQLIRQLSAVHKPRKRIAYHLSVNQLNQLMSYHSGSVVLEELVEILWKNRLYPKGTRVFDHRLTTITETILLHWFASDNPSMLLAIQNILKTMAEQWKQPIGQLIRVMKGAVKDGSELQQLLSELTLDGGETLAKKEEQESKENGLHLSEKEKDTDPQTYREQEGSPVDDPLSQAVAVQNAGIILLWPFMEGFFKKLKLIKNGNFPDHDLRIKAIHLLHYIASAAKEPEEYELIVCKILCGMPVDEPIPLATNLIESEKEFSDGIIQAMIGNWPAVGDTNVASIRSAYLQREGWIVKRTNGWLLKIERQTWDILLDSLPWGLGLVHLPWMDQMIHVEWKTV